MIKNNWLIAVFMAIGLGGVIGLTACSDGPRPDSAETTQRQATSSLMEEAQRQVGMPNMINFQERKLMKLILELRDKEDLICWAYIVAKYSGELKFLGKCVGYGLPYSVQFTNPERPEEIDVQGHPNAAVTVSMPDPNGLFMPSGLSATWLMLIDPKTGDPRPVYIEPEILVSPFPLHK